MNRTLLATILLENRFTPLQSVTKLLPDLLPLHAHLQSATLKAICTEYVCIREIGKQ